MGLISCNIRGVPEGFFYLAGNILPDFSCLFTIYSPEEEFSDRKVLYIKASFKKCAVQTAEFQFILQCLDEIIFQDLSETKHCLQNS